MHFTKKHNRCGVDEKKLCADSGKLPILPDQAPSCCEEEVRNCGGYRRMIKRLDYLDTAGTANYGFTDIKCAAPATPDQPDHEPCQLSDDTSTGDYCKDVCCSGASAGGNPLCWAKHTKADLEAECTVPKKADARCSTSGCAIEECW